VTSDLVVNAVAAAMQDPANQSQIDLALAGNPRAVNGLVGSTMKTINRKGDPIAIKLLLE